MVNMSVQPPDQHILRPVAFNTQLHHMLMQPGYKIDILFIVGLVSLQLSGLGNVDHAGFDVRFDGGIVSKRRPAE